MSSDRGTMTRGGSPSADHQPPWVEPTLPAGRRMPGAPRERKPLLVVLALLLIVVGAGAAGLLVTRMSHQVGAIEITKQIPQGQQISAADLAEVQVAADGGIPYVSWSDASVITKYFAGTTIPADTLLSRTMVSATDNLIVGKNVLGLALKDGQKPADLQVGQSVELYSTATQANSCQAQQAAGATQTQAQQGGSVLAFTATVVAIDQSKSGTGVTDVDVAVAPESAGLVACNASNGTVAVAAKSGNG